MKQIKFETSKGEFLLVDLPSYEAIEKELEIFGHDQGLTKEDLNNYFKHILPDFNKSWELSEITEEQASEIVQADEYYHGRHYYRNYVNKDGETYRSAIESLQSLLKSKGIHLYENPIKKHHYLGEQMIAKFQFERDWNKAEQKTFYNPLIFKL